jgi:hypothetical protein
MQKFTTILIRPEMRERRLGTPWTKRSVLFCFQNVLHLDDRDKWGKRGFHKRKREKKGGSERDFHGRGGRGKNKKAGSVNMAQMMI